MRKFTQFLAVFTSCIACSLGAVNQANAFTFTEPADMDAGDSLTTASTISGTAGTSSVINGNIDTSQDTDLFKFVIDVAGMTTFDANPAQDSGLNINLFLFNAMGNPMSPFAEPTDSNSMAFTLDLAAGTYFLGIGSDDLDAFDRDNNQIAGNDTTTIDPQGVLDHWTPGFKESEGKYTIALTTIPKVTDPTTPTDPKDPKHHRHWRHWRRWHHHRHFGKGPILKGPGAPLIPGPKLIKETLAVNIAAIQSDAANPVIAGTPVPTPALLPGLLILGTSLFRRKKESVLSSGEDWQGLA